MSKVIENKALELRRAYHRNWRKKNRERVREYDKSYWERKAEAMLEAADPKTAEGKESE